MEAAEQHGGPYRSVLSVCSQQAEDGDTLAIITVRACSPTNESRSTCALQQPVEKLQQRSADQDLVHA